MRWFSKNPDECRAVWYGLIAALVFVGVIGTYGAFDSRYSLQSYASYEPDGP